MSVTSSWSIWTNVFLSVSKCPRFTNESNRKSSYGRVVFHPPVWRHVCRGAANNPQYSMSRFNNQLPCEPLSNVEFCKAQLICCRNERLANCDSPQILPWCLHLCETSESVCVSAWVCECAAWGAVKWKANKQLERDADSSGTGWPARVHACMWCGCVEGPTRGLEDTLMLHPDFTAICMWRRL